MKNNKLIFITIIFVLFFLVACSFIAMQTKKEKLATISGNSLETTYPTIEMICVSKNGNEYNMFDIDGNFYKSIITKENNIDVGDVVLCGGYKDKNNIYQIEDFKNDKSTSSYFKLTIDLNINELNENWFLIDNNNVVNDKLWQDFVDKTNKNEPSLIKILDKTTDGDIISLLFYDGTSFFAIEDDSRVWSSSENSNKFIYQTKSNLEFLEINGLVLWYLTDTQDIGKTLLEDGTLSSIINGDSSENEVDMFWLWTDARNNIKANQDFIPWSEENEDIFPTFELTWNNIGKEGETFVIGEGESQLVGTIGSTKDESKTEKIDLSSAIIYKDDINYNKDVLLKGVSPLSGDLSNIVATCKSGSEVSINIKEDKNIDNRKITLKLWNGTDIENYAALPFLEQDLSSLDSFTINSKTGVIFGEISYVSDSYVGTWNFTINGKE